jgi:hypothetical protein
MVKRTLGLGLHTKATPSSEPHPQGEGKTNGERKKKRGREACGGVPADSLHKPWLLLRSNSATTTPDWVRRLKAGHASRACCLSSRRPPRRLPGPRGSRRTGEGRRHASYGFLPSSSTLLVRNIPGQLSSSGKFQTPLHLVREARPNRHTLLRRARTHLSGIHGQTGRHARNRRA